MFVCSRCDKVAVTQHLLLRSVWTWRLHFWLEWPTRMPTLLSTSCKPRFLTARLLCLAAPMPGNPQGRCPAQVPIHHRIWVLKGLFGWRPKSCTEEKGQECHSALCSRFGYRRAMEKLISVVFGWKEVPCQARQTGGGKAQGTRWGMQGASSSTLYPLWIIQLLSLCIFFSTGVRGSSPALPPTSAWQLYYATSLGFFSVWALISLFFLSTDTSVIEEVKYFSLSSPQNVEIFKEEVGGRLAPPALFPYCCHSLAVHHKMSPHAHCIVALSPSYVLLFLSFYFSPP